MNYDFSTGRQTFTRGKPNGQLTVSVFGRDVTFTGGPYKYKPENMIGVKMAREIDLPFDYSVPTPDFSVPPTDLVVRTATQSIVESVTTGRGIYVGCMAGQGRTGLFLASVLTLLTGSYAVPTVRSEYYPHAVETEGQERFVAALTKHSRSFRANLMLSLVRAGAINFTWLRWMSWGDRMLYLRAQARRFTGI